MSSRLSLCMIVKNEAPQLADCLAAVRPALDELIVVDTGSEDATRAVAQTAGARVFEFPWREDFSAARNESLKHATGEWILWLDADDRLDPGQLEKLLSLKRGLPPGRDQAYFFKVCSASQLGDIWCTQLRLFPRLAAARFENRVHEQIAGSLKNLGVSFAQRDIVIRHLGYADDSQIARKAVRNLALLERDLQVDPNNPLLHYDMARTLAGINQREKGLAHLRQAMDYPGFRENHPEQFLDAGLLMAGYYQDMGQPRPAAQLLDALAGRFPDDRRIAFRLAESRLLEGDPGEAIRLLAPLADQAWPLGYQPVNLDRLQHQIHYYLGLAHATTGNRTMAEKHYQRSLQFKTDLSRAQEALGGLLLETGNDAEAAAHLEAAIRAGRDTEENYQRLAQAYRQTGQRAHAEQAEAAARERNPGQKRETQERAWQQQLAQTPDDVEILKNLGKLRLEAHDPQAAAGYYQRAWELRPEDVAIGLGLSSAYLGAGDFERVVEACGRLLRSLGLACERRLDSLEDLADLYEGLGDHLAQTGQGQQALDAFLLGFQIYPRAARLRKIIPLATGLNCLEACQESIRESLAAHGQDPAVVAEMRQFAGTI